MGLALLSAMCWSSLQWRHNGRDNVSNHQHRECLLSRLIRRRSMKTPKLRVAGLCAGNSPETGEFPAQRASNAENVSIWWRHHVFRKHEIKYLSFFIISQQWYGTSWWHLSPDYKSTSWLLMICQRKAPEIHFVLGNNVENHSWMYKHFPMISYSFPLFLSVHIYILQLVNCRSNTKWPTFCRWHFQIMFVETFLSIFYFWFRFKKSVLVQVRSLHETGR